MKPDARSERMSMLCSSGLSTTRKPQTTDAICHPLCPLRCKALAIDVVRAFSFVTWYEMVCVQDLFPRPGCLHPLTPLNNLPSHLNDLAGKAERVASNTDKVHASRFRCQVYRQTTNRTRIHPLYKSTCDIVYGDCCLA